MFQPSAVVDKLAYNFVDDFVLQVAGAGGNVSAANGEVEPKKSKLSVAGPAKSVKGEIL
jgi:hypothetical protein